MAPGTDHTLPLLKVAADSANSAAMDCVVIGRNEGVRLVGCLNSLKGRFRHIVYVDSGSADESLQVAQSFGAIAVALDMSRPFTAARARNAGLAELAFADAKFVQMIDGDCTMHETWPAAALAFLVSHPQVAVVCGRRREQFPEASVYNRICDREWNTPVGNAKACGGDALFRVRALNEVGLYREDLIAGEEPELCVRLRKAGWKVWRLDAEMTVHDARLTRFGQWFRRSKRAGHAFAEGAALHGARPERHWVSESRRAIAWGLVLPMMAFLSALFNPAGLLLLLVYPLQVARLAGRDGLKDRRSWEYAALTTIGKFPEALGVATYLVNRLRRRKSDLVEYR